MAQVTSYTGVDRGWDDLPKLDTADVVRRTGALLDPSVGGYRLSAFGREFHVDLTARKVSGPDGKPVPFELALLILHYMVNAKDIAPEGRYVSCREMHGGATFFRGPHEPPFDRLKAKFGAEPSRLLQTMERVSGKAVPFADAAVEFLALPRVPVTVQVWKGDDEFPANANILFDATVTQHMALDVVLAVMKYAVKALCD